MLSEDMFDMLVYITSVEPEECVDALSDQLLVEQLLIVSDVLKNALLLRGCAGPLTTPTVPIVNSLIRWAAQDWAQFMWMVSYGVCIVEAISDQGLVFPEAAAIILAGQLGYLLAGDARYPAKWPLPVSGFVSDFPTGLSDLLSEYRSILSEEYDQRTYCGRDVTWTDREPPHWVRLEPAW